MKKDEPKSAVRRLSVPRYTPFQREQMRWALRSYQWRKGIAPEYYADEIRYALGLKKGDPGINDKDPKPFLDFIHEPKPEKLRLFERFIRSVCPEYLKAFTKEGLEHQLADVIFSFLSLDRLRGEDFAGLHAAARTMESYLFLRSERLRGRVEPSIFATRKFGDTPYLLAFLFETASLWELVSQPETAAVRIDPIARAKGLRADQTTSIDDLRSGILIPITATHAGPGATPRVQYVGFLKDVRNRLNFVHATFEGHNIANKKNLKESDPQPSDFFIRWDYYVAGYSDQHGASFSPFRNQSLQEIVSRFGHDLL